MTGSDTRVSLQACAALDEEIMRQRTLLNEALVAIKHATQSFKACEINRTTLSARLKELKKNLYEKEHELSECASALKNKNALLERCTNPKQYEVLVREIADLEKKGPALETIVFDLMTRADEEQAATADSSRVLDEKEHEQKNILEAAEKKHKDILASLEQLEQRRNEVLKELPVAWQNTYKELSETLPNPIVRILNNTCSGCYYAVSANDMAHIQKEYIGRCKDCYRMLFTFERDLEVLVQKATHL